MPPRGDFRPAGGGGLVPPRIDQQVRPGPQRIIAPGQGQVVVAQYVIIFGTNGGLFIYDGKPAKGNPPVFCITPPGVTEDPYGNTVSGGTASATSLPFLFYSPTAAAGNLIQSISAVSGSDQFTNAFLAGNTLYTQQTNGSVLALNIASGATGTYSTINLFSAPSPAGPFSGASYQLLFRSGELEFTGAVLLDSGASIGAGSGATFIGGAAPATPASGSVLLYANSNGALHRLSASTLDALVSGAQAADVTSFTVTGTGFSAITKSWTIPANDAQVGTVYRITMWGRGTQGSTQQQLKMHGFGGNAQVTTTTGFVGASLGFGWRAVSELIITGTGAGGTGHATFQLTVGNGGATPNFFATASTATGVTLDTTILNSFVPAAAWGSTTGSPTVTCEGSYFERLGA